MTQHSNPFSTNEAAAQLAMKPQTLRKHLCKHGHYYGVRPIKMRNGRWLWPFEDVKKLQEGK